METQNSTEMDNQNQFSRITLFNMMCNDLVSFAATKYGQQFYEFMDMNCGAMSEGDFETVIDPAAPKQFLELYTNIVMKRISLVCEKLLELGEGYKELLDKYFFDEAGKLGLGTPSDIMEALGMMQFCVLDGMLENLKIDLITQTGNCLEWKKIEISENALKENLKYWNFIKSFVRGLLKDSGIKFSVSNDGIFKLEK